MQSERRREVVKRINDLLSPVLADDAAAFSLRIERLTRSIKVVEDFSFGQKINASIAGKNGNINDVKFFQIQAALPSESELYR